VDAAKLQAYEFGKFRLDRRRRLLLGADGRPLAITPKAFDTLAYLLEHAGEMIERGTLLEVVWPNVVVEENNLSQAIASLRRLLGDEAIVTAKGRGYQLTVAVRAVADGEATPTRTDRKRPLYAAGAVAILATLTAILLYALGSDPGAPARDVALLRPGDPIETVAVLPFASPAEDGAQDAFAVGMTEELINRLTAVDSLQVTARTSSFAFRGSNRNVKEIAATLGVRHVLEGSIAREGERLRVRVQLVDAQTGYNLWSRAFDRTRADALAVQEEIASAVAESLLGRPVADERTLGGTNNVEAYDLYLAAKASTSAGWESLDRGLEQIERALELDPDFARGWAHKARILNQLEVRAGPTVVAENPAERAALRALEIEPRLGLAHAALGATFMTRNQRLRAEAAFHEALALGNTEDEEVYGLFLLSVGHISRARGYLSAVKARDPLNPTAAAWLAAAYERQGDRAAALAELERGRRLFDRWEAGLGEELLLAVGAGDVNAVQALPRLYPQLADELAVLAPWLDSLDEPGKALPILRAQYAERPPFTPFLLAVAAMLGEPELAIDGFVEMRAQSRARPGSATGIYWASVFRDMRRLPKFRELARAEGLVDYWREFGWPDLCRPLGADDFECR
jgi:TolB-like protein/DNA-binding winged helix-turn-helix (wHTH) protein